MLAGFKLIPGGVNSKRYVGRDLGKTIMIVGTLTLTTRLAYSAVDKLVIFFLFFFPEGRI